MPGNKLKDQYSAELERLQGLELRALELFNRVRQPGAFLESAGVIEAAEGLWQEAAAAVQAHQGKKRNQRS